MLVGKFEKPTNCKRYDGYVPFVTNSNKYDGGQLPSGGTSGTVKAPDGGQLHSVGASGSDGMSVDCICECPAHEDFPLVGVWSQDWRDEIPTSVLERCGMNYSDKLCFDDELLKVSPSMGSCPSMEKEMQH